MDRKDKIIQQLIGIANKTIPQPLTINGWKVTYSKGLFTVQPIFITERDWRVFRTVTETAHFLNKQRRKP